MNSFQSWLSIAANIGIVAGLVLVAFQINQESEIAATTLESELYANRVGYGEMVVGEHLAESLANAIYSPTSLSERDKVVLVHLYAAELVKTSRVEVLLQPGETAPISNVVRWAELILSNPYGRAWWDFQRSRNLLSRFIPKHQEAIDAYLATLPSNFSLRQAMDEIDEVMAQTTTLQTSAM
jgi:hypothetical protein